MDELTTRHLQVLHRVFIKAETKVLCSKLWLYFHNEYGVGIQEGRSLILNQNDHQRIREIVKQKTNIDLMQPLPTGSRIEVSKQIGNEKLFSEAPSRHHILLNSPKGQLNINGEVISLMVGSSYRCDWRELLNLDEVENVIIVENLQAFDYIQMANIPKELKNAWVLYRGHDISTKAVNDLIIALPKNSKIIAFVDYDPAGFKILFTNFSRVTNCLFPEPNESLFELAKGSKERFEKQIVEKEYCKTISLPESLLPHWNWLEKTKHCVSQEMILSHNILLMQYPL